MAQDSKRPQEPGRPADSASNDAADELVNNAVPAGDAEPSPEQPDPSGDLLGANNLASTQPGTVADEQADELTDPVVGTDTPGKADPQDVVTADQEQLSQAEETAKKAKSIKPVKRNQTVAPVKKAAPTAKQADAKKKAAKRTGPVTFVKQSIGELKKVVWPSGEQTWQYFVVVLIFVLFIMAVVAGLDALFGWILLKLLG